MSDISRKGLPAGDAEEDLLPPPQTGWKVFAAFALAFCVFVIGLIVWGVVAFSNAAEPPVVQTATSSDGTWTLQVLETSGGAGGHGSLKVVAKRAGSGHRYEALNLDPLRDFDVTWAGDDQLTIQWESNTAVMVGGIRVTLPPPAAKGG